MEQMLDDLGQKLGGILGESAIEAMESGPSGPSGPSPISASRRSSARSLGSAQLATRLESNDSQGVQETLRRNEQVQHEIILTAEDVVNQFTSKLSDRVEVSIVILTRTSNPAPT